MFNRYTEKARRVIFFGRYEASQFGSQTIETEHLLLGLLREDKSLSNRFLGGETAEPESRAELPAEIVEAHQRIESIVQDMENALASHEFEKARAASEAERREREKLGQLYQKYNLPDAPAASFHGGPGIESIRNQIESERPRGKKVSTSVDLPLSHECKRALAYGAEEAQLLKHDRIDTEHLFLGLLREESSLAARVLRERGVDLLKARAILSSGPSDTASAGRTGWVGRSAVALRSLFAHRPEWTFALQEAGRVTILARQEAAKLGSPCIETVHLLLALSHEKDLERFLGPEGFGVKPGEAGLRERVAAADLPFSEESKQALTYAMKEAAKLGQRTAPAHLLLGILRVENCAAAEILRERGLSVDGIRAKLDPSSSSGPEQGRNYV
jgi:ATP-dependent Clp protease ATP-binding subunit ClpA